MFKASAKKTASLKCCIKEDVSSQKAKRYLVGLCENRFVERHVSIQALVVEAPPHTFFQGALGGPNLRVYSYNNIFLCIIVFET